ncbi:hypothetical protein M0811_03623 [Anaeramoeba ignava]|uniref:Uncharacterized protein n=1 Tax=Anaeramoeba ignava TaxID=1746090 RepID=A0A9Q0L7M9_ANAIG|nr:hypothetical protein M0811_03623 [Anaeramoeba ignava]
MIVTVRLIKNFEYRVIKYMILKDVDENLSIKEFRNLIDEEIQKNEKFLPFRTYQFNKLKLFSIPQQAKPNQLSINLNDDENLILNEEKTLKESGIVSESEISYFNFEAYEKFKKDPKFKI